MITVTIVGILTAIAMPMYGDYVARSQVAEAFSVGSGLKVVLADFYATNGRFPKDNEEAGLHKEEDYATKYIEKIKVSSTTQLGTGGGGVNVQGSGRAFIEIKLHDIASLGKPIATNPQIKAGTNALIAGKSLILIGDPMKGAVFNWQCSGAYPSGGTSGVNVVLDDKFLPASCEKRKP